MSVYTSVIRYSGLVFYTYIVERADCSSVDGVHAFWMRTMDG